MTSYNPYDEAVIADPFPFYAELRRGPSAYHVPGTDIYVLSRYADVADAARRHEVFSSTGGVGPEWDPHPMLSMYDPPEHTRLRRIVARAFTPKTVDSLEPEVRAHAARLWAELGSRGKMDIVGDFAEPLVSQMIANLIGIPDETRSDFRRWSLVITETLGKNVAPERRSAAEADRKELVRTLRQMTAAAQRNRGEGLIAVLVDANEAERLTEPEVVAFCVLLLVAGFETTVNAVANVFDVFHAHPIAWESAIRSPEGVPRLVDEALRLAPPVHAFFRNTLSEVRYPDGSLIPERQKVMLNFASANRDADKFPRPDVFDRERNASAHLSFGQGVHTCLGATLARRVLAVCVQELLAARLRLSLTGEFVRTHNTILRGYKSLTCEIAHA